MRKDINRRFMHSGPLFLIAMPGILYLIINNYIPMLGIFLAFKDYDYVKGVWGSEWIGLRNFDFLFQTHDAFVITRNTLVYNFAFIAVGTVFSIFIALLLTELIKKVWAGFFQAALLLPNMLSWVVIAYIGFSFLNSDNGFINNTVFSLFGLKPLSWYSEAKVWPVILMIVYLWKNIGYISIIYMASISGIDPGIYEAAEIDGVNKIKQVFHITLPLIKSTVIIMVLMAIGRVFYSDFGLFYQVPMDSGALYDTTQTIDTYVYRGLMRLGDVGMTAAAGLYQSIVGFVLVLTANTIVRKINSNNALF